MGQTAFTVGTVVAILGFAGMGYFIATGEVESAVAIAATLGAVGFWWLSGNKLTEEDKAPDARRLERKKVIDTRSRTQRFLTWLITFIIWCAALGFVHWWLK